MDNCKWEPDKEFKIELCDEYSRERLEGDDTVCTIRIIDEDRPGVIGFRSKNIKIRRKDEVAYIHVQRFDGSDGDIACVLNSVTEHEALSGKKQA